MDKFSRLIIAISLLILALNSFRIASYLGNIVELMGGLLNVTN